MWADIGDFIGKVGFPSFVAIFVLVRLDPALRKLTQAITASTVVTARSNGMAGKDVAEIMKIVAESKDKRRIEDKVDGVVQSAKKK